MKPMSPLVVHTWHIMKVKLACGASLILSHFVHRTCISRDLHAMTNYRNRIPSKSVFITQVLMKDPSVLSVLGHCVHPRNI